MTPKFWIMAGLIVGSTVGSYVPALWGDSVFSFSSIILTFLGGFLGIWLGYKFSQNI